MADIDLTEWEKRLLKVVRDSYPKEHKKLLRKALNLLRKNVRRITPKVEGELRKSYRIKVKGKEEGDVYTNKYYAKMVEEGHETPSGDGFVPGKFYLKKATEKTEDELPDLLKGLVRAIGKELGMDVSG